MKKIKIVVFCLLILLLFSCSKNNSAQQGESISVIDAIGRTVTVSETPKRIVSLAPASTEIIFAIGAQENLVARTDLCDYPAEVKNVASLGGFDGKTFSLEKVLAFEPDFVYATATMHDHLIEPLEKYGITVYVSSASSVENVKNEILSIGLLTGKKDNAAKIISDIDEKVQKVQKVSVNAKENPPLVYWEVWNMPYMTAGGQSFMNDLIEKAGGKNIFADVSQSYPVVSEESIIMRNPEIILFPNDSGLTKESIASRPNWQETNAVKDGRIYQIDANILTRSGARIADSIDILSAIFYGE